MTCPRPLAHRSEELVRVPDTRECLAPLVCLKLLLELARVVRAGRRVRDGAAQYCDALFEFELSD